MDRRDAGQPPGRVEGRGVGVRGHDPERYAEPHDPNRPVVCFDDASKELRDHATDPIPVAPGKPAKEDYEYVRDGTANLFVAVEPLAGARHVAVTERRATPDFAARTKHRCDVRYPDAAVIRVVLDNRNTHAFGSLFATDPPDEAWRLRRKPESHYTPKHASWRGMAECELSVLSRRCLGRRIPDKAALATEAAAWQEPRNRARVKIEWTFRVADARKKLDFLYPKELMR